MFEQKGGMERPKPSKEQISLPLGQVVATPGALSALTEAGIHPFTLLSRHRRGDWGDLDSEDKHLNDISVDGEGRVLSAYTLTTGERIWIITEWDRSVSTLLLPSEY